MATYRQIHIHIWQDEWFLDLPPTDKLLFIYLFSNGCTRLCGLYKIALKVIVFETGMAEQDVKAALQRFTDAGKVCYQDGWIWVVHFARYNSYTASPKTLTAIRTELEETPDTLLRKAAIQGLGMDTLSIPYLYPTDTQRIITVTEQISNTTDQNKSFAALAAPSPPPAPEIKPAPKQKAPPYTADEVRFVEAFGAKRVNPTQREIVAKLLTNYPAQFWEGVTWAAERGMAMGDAIRSLKTALPKWGKPKERTHGITGRDNGNNPPQPAIEIPDLEFANAVRAAHGGGPITQAELEARYKQ